MKSKTLSKKEEDIMKKAYFIIYGNRDEYLKIVDFLDQGNFKYIVKPFSKEDIECLEVGVESDTLGTIWFSDYNSDALICLQSIIGGMRLF